MSDPTEDSITRIGFDHSHLGGGNPSGSCGHHNHRDRWHTERDRLIHFQQEEVVNVTQELNSLHLLVEQIREAVWRMLRFRR